MVTEKGAAEGGCTSWLVVGGVILGLVLVLNQCSSEKDEQAIPSYDAPVLQAAPTPTPTPVLELTSTSTRRASKDFQAISSQPGSEKLYSENCYAALAAEFSWPKLDSCGAFDQLVIRQIGADNGTNSSVDLTYFEPEAAAGRYLGSATAHGQLAELADQRLAGLQRLTAQAPLPRTDEPVSDDEVELLDEEPVDQESDANPMAPAVEEEEVAEPVEAAA